MTIPSNILIIDPQRFKIRGVIWSDGNPDSPPGYTVFVSVKQGSKKTRLVYSMLIAADKPNPEWVIK